MHIRQILNLAFALTFCLAVCHRSPAHAQDDASRVVIVVRSADSLLADLEHMVVNMAGMQNEWDNNVFPNIDIFLIGVDKQRPLRFDQILDAEAGQRPQFMIPYSDLKEFIEDNLDPIGIIADRQRRDRTLYELSGGVYDGWMRVEHDYAIFAGVDRQKDLPAGFDDPAASHQDLLDKGYDIAARLDNAATTPEQRSAAFVKFRDNVMAGLQKRPAESTEAFTLRQTSTQHQMAIVERIFVQSSDITIGWTTDSEQGEGRGALMLAAIPDSDLAATLNNLGAARSYFHNIASADNAVLSGRLNFALDELLTTQFREFYELSRPVAHQKIDETEGKTDEQKAARKQIGDLLFDILDEGLTLGVWDAAVEITPQESGKHTLLVGMRAADGTRAAEIVKLLPDSGPGWASELDVDKEGDVAIHKVSVTENYPAAFVEFFGEQPDFYVGTGKDAVWIAGGEGAVDAMKHAIQAVAESPEGEAEPTVASLNLHLLPILKMMNQLREDGEFDLTGLLNQGAAEETPAPEDPDAETPSTRDMLKDFEWRATAIEALQGGDDRVEFKLQRVEDHLEGDATVRAGLLKAIGQLIAKFARDNLG